MSKSRQLAGRSFAIASGIAVLSIGVVAAVLILDGPLARHGYVVALAPFIAGAAGMAIPTQTARRLNPLLVVTAFGEMHVANSILCGHAPLDTFLALMALLALFMFSMKIVQASSPSLVCQTCRDFEGVEPGPQKHASAGVE